MFNQLPPLKSLRAFESAARHSSFKNAANELSVTPGAISYQIRILEEHLGLTLFERQTRQVVLSSAGKHMFGVVRNVFRDLSDGIEKIQPSRKQSVLTISVSTFFMTRWLSPRLGKFINQNPDVAIRIQHSVNDPGFSFDEIDMAIRWGNGKWPGYKSELILESPMMAVCSPRLCQGTGGLKTLDQLSEQNLLRDQKGNDYWYEWLSMAGHPEPENFSGPLVVDPNVRVQAAIDGHGVILGNTLLKPELDSKVLIEPFHFRLQGLGFHLVYRTGSLIQNQSVRFRSWLMEKDSIL